MSILKIKDTNGNIIDIPALRGPAGKSAYQMAQEGGYTGTEDQFIEQLGSLTDILPIEKGGTGANNVEEALQNLGISALISSTGLKSESGSYAGTGNGSISLVFSFVPKVIIITGISTSDSYSIYTLCVCYVALGKTVYFCDYNDYEISSHNGIGSLALNDTTVTIYSSSANSNDGTFYYVAFG